MRLSESSRIGDYRNRDYLKYHNAGIGNTVNIDGMKDEPLAKKPIKLMS